ncbi:hypothetical protein K402DRAFT_452929 [Aulographum hederae CBS 113979]|uniref:Uncharacterized protein n=1 Tax=Aulographum hederae CBS 113979 TaxID=1176131 RepID=A0A6G1H4Q8_9PEZI|nr:hypothetical protein K402DRAFT_452929 [Aulographum hederae CBS 113979]
MPLKRQGGSPHTNPYVKKYKTLRNRESLVSRKALATLSGDDLNGDMADADSPLRHKSSPNTSPINAKTPATTKTSVPSQIIVLKVNPENLQRIEAGGQIPVDRPKRRSSAWRNTSDQENTEAEQSAARSAVGNAQGQGKAQLHSPLEISASENTNTATQVKAAKTGAKSSRGGSAREMTALTPSKRKRQVTESSEQYPETDPATLDQGRRKYVRKQKSTESLAGPARQSLNSRRSSRIQQAVVTEKGKSNSVESPAAQREPAFKPPKIPNKAKAVASSTGEQGRAASSSSLNSLRNVEDYAQDDRHLPISPDLSGSADRTAQATNDATNAPEISLGDKIAKDFQELLARHAEEKQQLKEQLEIAERDLQEESQRISGLHEELDNTASHYDEKIEKLTADLNNQRKKNAAYQTELNSSRAAISAKTNRITELESKVTKLEQQITTAADDDFEAKSAIKGVLSKFYSYANKVKDSLVGGATVNSHHKNGAKIQQETDDVLGLMQGFVEAGVFVGELDADGGADEGNGENREL